MKDSKLKAEYTPQAKGSFCKDCSYYRGTSSQSGSCIEVSGIIDPKGSCRHFETKKATVGAKK